ncbi:pyridoxamine 5'-phosphate oxidase family protein [Kordiimonas aestuarii]|uniref:pyridoxamine 5'-phosphate oxidase family protein n=1 Tax=Kordiimonas aestuarii TaxID=1005925 RepID=UPI0021CFE12F|nr:pyridoxamine 5'-phosphate oxidase family protein [Kordiimonas aestuarii]
MDGFQKNDRNRARRGHQRAAYDADTVYRILDSHFLCHVGFEIAGQPHVIPTSYWREGNRLYWHGSSASHMVRHLSGGNPATVCVTHLDGLVLARSAFNTSVNYRSVVCFGVPELVTEEAEFDRQMELFFDQLAPARWHQLRPLTAQERKATGLLVMEIEDASAKVRTGGPGDGDEADWPVWAGHVDIHTVTGTSHDAPEGARSPLSHGVLPAFHREL